jgi:16S rRNA (uracil1498-N3)-methyltransferase
LVFEHSFLTLAKKMEHSVLNDTCESPAIGFTTLLMEDNAILPIKPSIRLFVEGALAEGASITATSAQANYLMNVMRLHDGDRILAFNGRDGEWLTELQVMRRNCALIAQEKTREQTGGPDIHYLFAPLKKARLDYMVQKATELGVAALQPVMTRRTIAERVNLERMRANAIEAAEQCGVLHIPEISVPDKLKNILSGWSEDRSLIFADEAAEVVSPIEKLSTLATGPIALLIGPEGGFDDEERAILHTHPFVHAISLGPRVMRADTAAVAGLALLNAVLGDWR